MAKQKQRITPLPDIKTGVTAAQLEEIALRSQNGLNVRESGPDSAAEMLMNPKCREGIERIMEHERQTGKPFGVIQFNMQGGSIVIDQLGTYGRQLGIDIGKTATGLKKAFKSQTLLVADVNCSEGRAAAQLNQIDGVEAFGAGGEFLWNPRSGLPRNRFIVEEANDLAKTIPENSFHFMVSRVMEKRFERVPKVFPSLFKVLKPGGLAVFDLEFWWENLEEITALEPEIQKSLTLVNKKTGYSNNLKGYISDWNNEEKHIGNASLTHFEMRKPR